MRTCPVPAIGVKVFRPWPNTRQHTCLSLECIQSNAPIRNHAGQMASGFDGQSCEANNEALEDAMGAHLVSVWHPASRLSHLIHLQCLRGHG